MAVTLTTCPGCYMHVRTDRYSDHVCDPTAFEAARAWERELVAANDANPTVRRMRRRVRRRAFFRCIWDAIR